MNHYSRELLPKLVKYAILGLIIVVFIRITIMATQDSRDFAIIYLSSISWIHGNDPYKSELFYNNWTKAEGPPAEIPGWPSLYPICTFPLIAPLTLLTWPYAKFIWILINCLAYIGLLMLLFSLMDIHINEFRGIIIFGFSLLFIPVQHAIIMGQPVILAILCGVVSLWLVKSDRLLCSGIFLALSLSLKLNLGVIFFGYFIIYRRWKILGFCLVTMMIIIAIGALRFAFIDFSWVFSWINNLQVMTKEWVTTKPAISNPNSVFLLNLQYPLYKIINNKFIVNAFVFTIGFIEFIILLFYYKYNKGLYGKLIMLTTISTIVLISSYHRLADASILIFLLILIALLINTQYRKYSKILLVLFMPIYLPGPRYLQGFVEEGMISHSIASSWWWNALILPYQVFCLLLISIVMMLLVVIDKRNLSNFNKLT
jgi:hypothetical protein